MEQITFPWKRFKTNKNIWKNSFRQQSSRHAGQVSPGCPWRPHSPVPGRWAWPGPTHAGLSRGLPGLSVHQEPLAMIRGNSSSTHGDRGVSAPNRQRRKHSQRTGVQAQHAEGHCFHLTILLKGQTEPQSPTQFQETIQKHLIANKVKSKMPGIHSKFTGHTKKQKNRTWRRKKKKNQPN